MTIVGNIRSGEFIFDGSAQQLPDIACDTVLIKARSTNGAACYIGGVGVTAPNGVTDITTGYELLASEELIVNIPRLSQLYVIGTNLQGLVYLVLA